jgi:hypothetical protein
MKTSMERDLSEGGDQARSDGVRHDRATAWQIRR